MTAIEVKSARARDVRPGLDAFAAAFRSTRSLLVGADGIGVEEFLRRPVAEWIQG